MRSKRYFKLVLIITVVLLGFVFWTNPSNKIFAAKKKHTPRRGHVNFIHEQISKIVIDDKQMDLAVPLKDITEGTYVEFTVDKLGRVIDIKRLDSNSQSLKIKNKRIHKQDLPHGKKIRSKFKKTDGIWRNY